MCIFQNTKFEMYPEQVAVHSGYGMSYEHADWARLIREEENFYKNRDIKIRREEVAFMDKDVICLKNGQQVLPSMAIFIQEEAEEKAEMIYNLINSEVFALLPESIQEGIRKAFRNLLNSIV